MNGFNQLENQVTEAGVKYYLKNYFSVVAARVASNNKKSLHKRKWFLH